MHKYEHNLLPSFFNHMYVYSRDVHQVNTRQADTVHPAKSRTVLASKSLRISAVGIWNDILSNLGVDLSFSLFKKNVYLSIVYIKCIVYINNFLILAETEVVIFYEYSCMVNIISNCVMFYSLCYGFSIYFCS